MGRFSALAAALPVENTDVPDGSAEAFMTPLAAVPDRIRRLTRRTVPDPARLERLSYVGIQRPAGPLRTSAIQRAALVQSHTREMDEIVDAKATRILARYLYDEGLIHGEVDEERALIRSSVDQWLYRDDLFSIRAQRTYRTFLYAAGRVLYPNQFPEPQRSLGPRRKAVQPASIATASELYAIAPQLPELLRKQLLTILDLVTGAGLSSAEIRRLRGTDVKPLSVDDLHTVVAISIRKKGAISRVVPIVCPVRGQRILDRAREAGDSYVFPCFGDKMPRNAVCHVSEELVERGFRGFNTAALRNRWVAELATHPGVPAAMLLAMTGIADLRVLHDIQEALPDYRPADFARTLYNLSGELS